MVWKEMDKAFRPFCCDDVDDDNARRVAESK